MDIPKPKRPRLVCGHCDQELSNSHYYDHRKRFFSSGVWHRKNELAGSHTVQDLLLLPTHPENTPGRIAPAVFTDPEKPVVEEIEDAEEMNPPKKDNDDDADDQCIHLVGETNATEGLLPPLSSDDSDTDKTDDQSVHLCLDSSDSDSVEDEGENVSGFVGDDVASSSADFEFQHTVPGQRLLHSPDITHVRRFAAECTGSPATEPEKMLMGSINGLSRQLTQLAQLVTQNTAVMAAMEARLASLEEAAVESRATNCGCSDLKRKRRVHKPKIAETVRRLHNSEGNDRRYDPVQGLSSPHNEAVTSHLVEALIASPEMCGVDSGVLISVCKTYYETLRKSYRYSQPDLAAQAEAMRGAARSRQRRKRLLEARRAVLAKEEMDFWRGITVDMMSDEEDGTADGEAGWIVRPPSFRSQELSELCSVLQERLERDPKYLATHHRRLHNGPPSARPAPASYDPEAAKRHFS